MLPFSEGSRQCLGISLAHAEMYLMPAFIFKWVESDGENGLRDEDARELWEIGLGDVEIEADGFIPLVREGSKGIRMTIKRELR